MRLLQLPNDFLPMAEMIWDTWQYPENPEWSLQQDEQESMIEGMKSIRRIWPIIRLAQWILIDYGKSQARSLLMMTYLAVRETGSETVSRLREQKKRAPVG